MLDPGDVLLDDLQAVPPGISDPRHDSDRKKRGKRIGQQERTVGHAQDPRSQEELDAQAGDVPPEEDEGGAPAAELRLQFGELLRRKYVPKALSLDEGASEASAEKIEQRIGDE